MAQAGGWILFAAALVFIRAVSARTYAPLPAEEKITSSVIQSYVYCQNCYKEWSRHLTGAEVIVECREKRGGAVLARGKGTSNPYGYVEVELAGYDYKKNYDAHVCLVRILRSSDPSCDYRTNVNNGYSGAKPVFSKILGEVAYFHTKHFAFSPMCS